MNEEIEFRDIYEHIDVPVFVVHIDATGGFVFDNLNPAYEKATGLDKEAIAGKSPEEIPGISREDITVLQGNFQRCLEAGDVIDCEDPLLNHTNEAHWLTQLSPVRDQSGTIVRLVGTSTKVTGSNQNERILAARLRLVDLADSNTLDELLTATLDEMEALTGSSIGLYYFIEADQQSFFFQNCSTNTPQSICIKAKDGNHFNIAPADAWGVCINERRTIINNDYMSIPHLNRMPEDDVRINRQLLVPIVRGNHVKAIVCLGNKPDNYNANDGKMVSQLGDLIWDIVERKQAERALLERKEQIQQKLDAILVPEIDIDTLELSEIIDSGKIQKLMDKFYSLTHIGIGILDLHGNVLVGTGWQDICTKFHRVNPKSCQLCIQSDLELSGNVTPGQFKQYKCKNNMWDIATPIMLRDRHIGNIFLGQFLYEDETLDYEVFRKQARKYGFNEEEYIAALDRVPRWSRETVDATISFYAAFAQMIGDLSYSNIKLANTLEKRKLAEDALRRSDEEKTILNRIANVFLTIPDKEMYGEVLRIVLQVMKSRFGIFGYLGENGDLVIPSLTTEVWDECRIPGKSIVFPKDSWGKSLWGRAISEKKTFCSDGPFQTPEGHIRIDHFLTVPIIYRQEPIGLLSVANKEGGYDQRDQSLLERIAREISPILHARIERNIQEQRRKLAERELRESEEKYRLLITNAGEAIFIIQDEVVKFQNPRTLEMIGFAEEELVKTPFLDLIHSGDRETVRREYFGTLKEERHPRGYPFRIINKEGKEMWVQLTTAPITWEKKPGSLCFLRDVTEEKRLETQLFQAQKMEAVGRFAGGVAHDFNNMLLVVIGHTELALMSIDPSSPLYERIQKILKAARRSADLTRQLLAFARKQTIAPKVLDLNDTVSTLIEMLQRLIGEDIDLAWKPGEGLWYVKIDPGQIDQVLANLCVNARDAISSVGKVTIETENRTFDEAYCTDHTGFVPGEYVMLAVSDDGHGMDEETLTHLFEPFFTTKGLGKGTGLGLATVYGIVKQNDGFINVYSEPGLGTTFKIYFLRHKGELTELPLKSVPEESLGGKETILVVEDEIEVLDLSKKILERMGYKVLAAKTPGEAIHMVKEFTNEIHLLLTDVVMPEMNGRELVARLSSIKPGLKCLYMSGYTANVITHRGVLDEGVCFIQKPFSTKDLAIKVREVLDKELPCISE